MANDELDREFIEHQRARLFPSSVSSESSSRGWLTLV
jgi:hypothetical protein